MVRRLTPLSSIFSGSVSTWLSITSRCTSRLISTTERRYNKKNQGLVKVNANGPVSHSPSDSATQRLFSSWQQGLVASLGAVMGIGAIGLILYVSMRDDTVHHTAAVASEALGDVRLRERATQLSKEVVESVLKDKKSLDLVVGLVVRVLQEDDSMIAVSSFLRALFEDHYTQEVTKKFVLMTVLDPWVQEQIRVIAKDLVKDLLRDPEVKKALVKFLSECAATSLHDEKLHHDMAHTVRSVAKQAVNLFR